MGIPSSAKTHGLSVGLQEFLDQKAVANPEQIAVKLLNHDGETQELIGIHSAGNRAFYIDHGSSVIIGVPLSEDVLESHGLIVAKLTHPDNVDVWVRKFDVCLGWIHPRHR